MAHTIPRGTYEIDAILIRNSIPEAEVKMIRGLARSSSTLRAERTKGTGAECFLLGSSWLYVTDGLVVQATESTERRRDRYPNAMIGSQASVRARRQRAITAQNSRETSSEVEEDTRNSTSQSPDLEKLTDALRSIVLDAKTSAELEEPGK